MNKFSDLHDPDEQMQQSQIIGIGTEIEITEPVIRRRILISDDLRTSQDDRDIPSGFKINIGTYP